MRKFTLSMSMKICEAFEMLAQLDVTYYSCGLPTLSSELDLYAAT